MSFWFLEVGLIVAFVYLNSVMVNYYFSLGAEHRYIF